MVFARTESTKHQENYFENEDEQFPGDFGTCYILIEESVTPFLPPLLYFSPHFIYYFLPLLRGAIVIRTKYCK